jgi:hypothetical protein
LVSRRPSRAVFISRERHKNRNSSALAAFFARFSARKKYFNKALKSCIRWPFVLVELSFATAVCVQISRQLCVPFCLKRGGFFEGAKAFCEEWAVSTRPRLACESQQYGGRRRCKQTPGVPVVETGERPGQGIQTANDRRPASRSGRPQRAGRKAGRGLWEPAGSLLALPVPFRRITKALLSRMDQTGATTASRPDHNDAGR